MGERSVSTSVVAILIRPHSRPYQGKDLCRIHERQEMCFLNFKSVRSCKLILKPNSVRWWERALCVCLCASRRNSAMRDTESRGELSTCDHVKTEITCRRLNKGGGGRI